MGNTITRHIYSNFKQDSTVRELEKTVRSACNKIEIKLICNIKKISMKNRVFQGTNDNSANILMEGIYFKFPSQYFFKYVTKKNVEYNRVLTEIYDDDLRNYVAVLNEISRLPPFF